MEPEVTPIKLGWKLWPVADVLSYLTAQAVGNAVYTPRWEMPGIPRGNGKSGKFFPPLHVRSTCPAIGSLDET